MRLRQYDDHYESQDDESDYDFTNDYESDPDADYAEVGREVTKVMLPVDSGKRVRSGLNFTGRAGVPAEPEGLSDHL